MAALQALRSRYLALTVAVFAFVSAPAYADDAEDVSALIEAGRYDTALIRTSAYVQKNPGDPQMRFLQGVSMASLGRTADAIAIFTALTADFPELAEPYVNLGALYAASRDYDNARTALEKAIRVDTGFGTAYEYLGDVYLKLAGQAYSKALQIVPDSADAKQRKSMLDSIDAQREAQPRPAATAKISASTAHSEKDAVLETVKEWTEAWSARDVAGYLKHYAADFRTPNREPRSVWEKRRRALIEGKARIEVIADSPEVTFSKHFAAVTYRQIYVSDNYTSKERKTLIFRKDGMNWKIVEEHSGS